MAAKIPQLINRPDNFEVIRDQIAAILVVESAAQEAFAAAGYQDVTVVADGDNIGDGTCTAASVVGTPVVGTWELVCTAAVADGGVFDLVDPSSAVAVAGLTLTPGEPSTAFTDQAGLSFTLNVGAVDFDAGDTFSLPVAHYDASLWRLKVFRERLNPWSDFLESPDDATPIVNVSYDASSFDKSKSNAVERQLANSTFFIDCFGYGISSDEADGHQPGDEEAALNTHRTVRLVRSILMAGPYTYLAMQGVVGFRWPDSIQIQHPQSDGRFVQNIVGARIALQVQHNEFSPQAQGQPLELISAQVKRSETGQLLLSTNYP